MSARAGFRFSPHVLVFLLTLYVQIPPLRGTIVAFVHSWWGSTYRQVEYVMDEGRPNDGSPYIAGHLEGSTDQLNVVAEMQGSTMVVAGVPQEAVAPGKRIRIWHSETAPTFGVFGDTINNIPVAALPERPGLISLVLHFAWFVATWIAGFLAMAWVAARWSRSYGDPVPRRRR